MSTPRVPVRSRPAARMLVGFLMLVLMATVTAIPAMSASAALAGPVGSGLAAADPPTARDDFARLPERCYEEPYAVVSPCRVTHFPGRPWMVLWGDSHALMYTEPLRLMAAHRRVNLVVLTAGSCPVALPAPGTRRGYCERHNTASLAYVRRVADRYPRVKVVIGSFWSNYRRNHALVEREKRTGQPSGVIPYHAQLASLAVNGSGPMFRALARTRVSIDVIAQAGTVPDDARRCTAGEDPYQCDLPRERAIRQEARNDTWLRARAALLPRRTRVIDPSPVYCDATTCYARVRGVNTYYDDIHVGKRLSRTMRPYFEQTFRDLLR